MTNDEENPNVLNASTHGIFGIHSPLARCVALSATVSLYSFRTSMRCISRCSCPGSTVITSSPALAASMQRNSG